MTPDQLEIATLLRGLGKSAELIAIQTGLPLEGVTAWLKTDTWPTVDKQRKLFDAGANEPREMIKPAIATRRESGLHLFSSAGDKPDFQSHSGRS